MQSVYIYHVDHSFAEIIFAHYRTLLSVNRCALIDSYAFQIDKILCLVSELLLRCVVCKHLGIKNTYIQFKHYKSGKPYLVGHPDFYFNIAHTNAVVVIAVSQTAIGVDVEVVKEFNLKVVERFFSPDEQRYINSGPKAEQSERALEIWTKKEAYLKCTGDGLSRSLCSFSVLKPPIINRLHSFKLFDFIISVCNDSFITPLNTIIVSNEMFFSLLQDLK